MLVRLHKYLLMRMKKFLLCICKHHICKRFSENFLNCVFLDGTYKTNYYRMPLYTNMVEDGNGVSIPVVHFWVADETTITLEKAFQCFTNHNEVDKVRLFIIDKDFQEQMLIRKFSPMPKFTCVCFIL